jgi:hypothetical protein
MGSISGRDLSSGTSSRLYQLSELSAAATGASVKFRALLYEPFGGTIPQVGM